MWQAQAACAQDATVAERAQAEFERWKAEQAEVEQARAQAEFERFSPLVAEQTQSVDPSTLSALVEQIRNSRVLNPETRSQLLAPLLEQQVVLLSAEAGTALAEQRIEDARKIILKASTAVSEIPGQAPSAAVLVQTQGRYIEAACELAEKAGERGDWPVADQLLDHARGMHHQLAISDGPVAKAAQQRLAEAERKRLSQTVMQTIARAERAEQAGNMRLSLFLYEDARRNGGDTSEALERVLAQRRSPWVEGGMSLLVPGLGQVVHGRPVPALLFFVGTVGLAATGMLLNQAAETRYDAYQRATTVESEEARYNAVMWRAASAYAVLGSAVFLHLWNVYDAYADAKQFNRDHFQ